MSTPRRLPRIRTGFRAIDRALATWREAIERGGRITADAPLEVQVGEAGTAIRIVLPPAVWAKLTGNAGAAYAWTEQVAAAGGGWTDGQRSGTTSDDPAYEWNGVDSVPADTVVRLERDPSADEWRFQADTCPGA